MSRDMAKLTAEQKAKLSDIILRSVKETDKAFSAVQEAVMPQVREFIATLENDEQAKVDPDMEAMSSVLTAFGAVFFAVVARMSPEDAVAVLGAAQYLARHLRLQGDAPEATQQPAKA